LSTSNLSTSNLSTGKLSTSNLSTGKLSNLQKRQIPVKSNLDDKSIDNTIIQQPLKNINKINFQIPNRLEMELPYRENVIPENINPSNMMNMNMNMDMGMNMDMDRKLLSDMNNDFDTKIKQIIKKSAELSFLALENKDSISSLKSSNYAIAYINVLKEFFNEEQIQNATGINISEYKNHLLKIQNQINSSIQNSCSTFSNDKQYLLKIINDM
jgi:hypothetical protein